MPHFDYDYVCLDCKHPFKRTLRSYKPDNLRIVCTKCGSQRVERVMMALTYARAFVHKRTA